MAIGKGKKKKLAQGKWDQNCQSLSSGMVISHWLYRPLRTYLVFPISKMLFFMIDEAIDLWGLTYHSGWSKSLAGDTQMMSPSVQSLSRVRLFATPWIATRQASLSITNSRSWLKLMSIESVMPSSHLILCRPLLLLPPVPPSIRVFSSESTLWHEVAKELEFQLQPQSFQWTPRTDLL